MFRHLKFIIFSSLTLSGDILFSLALIWRVLALDGSAKMLGMFLCIVTLLTFILQKMSSNLKEMLEKNPRHSFALARLGGFGCSILFIPLLWKENMFSLYAAGIVFTIINYLSTLTIEAVVAQKVLSNELNSHKASRMLQIIVLASSFLGASILGCILSFGNMKSVLLFNMTTYFIGAVFFLFFSKNNLKQENRSTTSSLAHQNKIQGGNLSILWFSFIGLFFLLIQISAFNFLVPLIAQHEKGWTATQFGFIDAAAEFGGFLATFLIVEKGVLSKLWLISFVVILLVDVLFYAVNSALAIYGSVFTLGLFVCAYRMKQREIIFNAVSGLKEIYEWTGRITAMTTFLKAFAPIMLAFVSLKPSFDLMLVGIVVSIGIMLLQFGMYFNQKRTLFYLALSHK